jgi:3-deoxy-manno-octulosonate cytidylyltransferase (CMP-KDO synthetase)
LNPIVIIPARMASTRLPGKPLADIHGAPMIAHVARRAEEAAVGPVVVACAEPEIAAAATAAGAGAVLTPADLASGSDRVHACLAEVDPDGAFDTVVNLQGDLPTLAPGAIRAVLGPLADPAVDIATLACASGRALYFSRLPVPGGPGPLYHHIGLYAFRRTALERFVALPPGVLEVREKLDQLRALEAGMRIDAALVDEVPLGVDTPADLERARALLAPQD